MATRAEGSVIETNRKHAESSPKRCHQKLSFALERATHQLGPFLPVGVCSSIVINHHESIVVECFQYK
jgi:hypothetical protein